LLLTLKLIQSPTGIPINPIAFYIIMSASYKLIPPDFKGFEISLLIID